VRVVTVDCDEKWVVDKAATGRTLPCREKKPAKYSIERLFHIWNIIILGNSNGNDIGEQQIRVTRPAQEKHRA